MKKETFLNILSRLKEYSDPSESIVLTIDQCTSRGCYSSSDKDLIAKVSQIHLDEDHIEILGDSNLQTDDNRRNPIDRDYILISSLRKYNVSSAVFYIPYEYIKLVTRLVDWNPKNQLIMKVNDFITRIKNTLTNNIHLSTSSEVEIVKNNKRLGYINKVKVGDYKITLVDSKYDLRKYTVLDLLYHLNRVKDIKGRKNKDIVYSSSLFEEYDIISVYFKLEVIDSEVKYCKLIIYVR